MGRLSHLPQAHMAGERSQDRCPGGLNCTHGLECCYCYWYSPLGFQTLSLRAVVTSGAAAAHLPDGQTEAPRRDCTARLPFTSVVRPVGGCSTILPQSVQRPEARAQPEAGATTNRCSPAQSSPPPRAGSPPRLCPSSPGPSVPPLREKMLYP